jgi:hypothetical protein
MKAEQFDSKFDNGESIIEVLDLSSAHRPGIDDIKSVNVDFPLWMVDGVDNEANRMGITRQSIIKVWVAERLQKIQTENAKAK